MSKFLIFSDIHIACHKKSTQRLQHCLDALEWIFKTAEQENIKNILFCGDLFHDRQKIEVLTYHKTFEIFLKYKEKFNIFLLLGNHDMWFNQKTDVSSVYPLQSMDNVKIIDNPCTLNIDGIDISFLPYTKNPLEDIKKISNNSKFKILLGHVAIDGAMLNSYGTIADVMVEHDGDLVKVGIETFNDWDRVFLGHYHAEQKLNNKVEYVGSPLELSFGEAFQSKHIIIYDAEKDKKIYIKNEFSPKHLIVHEKDIGNYDIKNNFIKLQVDDITSSELIEMRHDLVKNYNLGSLEIKQVNKNKNEEKVVKDAKNILIQEDKMLEKWIDSEKKCGKIEGLLENKLLEIGKNICNIG